jgi:arylsulfatase A-like enzyme
MGYAMRTERYRYIEWLDRETWDLGARELYDHQQDPEENKNIAADSDKAELLEQLSRQMWKTLPRPKSKIESR